MGDGHDAVHGARERVAPQRKTGVLVPGEGGGDPHSITGLLYTCLRFLPPFLCHMVDASQRECEDVPG